MTAPGFFATDLFSQFPEAGRAKVKLAESDAFGSTPDSPVDLLMPDIWLPLIARKCRRLKCWISSV